jgi:hypothetical protein
LRPTNGSFLPWVTGTVAWSGWSVITRASVEGAEKWERFSGIIDKIVIILWLISANLEFKFELFPGDNRFDFFSEMSEFLLVGNSQALKWADVEYLPRDLFL